MPRQISYWLLLLAVGGITLSVDQLSKAWIVENLQLYETRQPIPALREVFQIMRSHNSGAAFGILQQGGDIFLVIAVVVVGAMLLIYPRLGAPLWITRLGMGLVMGGALGNALDRLTHGYVIDFINYRIPDLISNVSNLADHAIVLGVGLILFDSIRLERAAKRSEAAAAPESAEG